MTPWPTPSFAGDFDLGHLGGVADHREVHRVDPVHLLSVSVRGSDICGELRVGQQLVEALVTAGEAGFVWRGGLVVTHGFSL